METVERVEFTVAQNFASAVQVQSARAVQTFAPRGYTTKANVTFLYAGVTFDVLIWSNVCGSEVERVTAELALRDGGEWDIIEVWHGLNFWDAILRYLEG